MEKPNLKKKITTTEIGKTYEYLAERIILKKGYTLLERNYIVKHVEIDRIFRLDDMIVFVEVKARSNMNYGQPQEFIDKNKIRNLLKASKLYIMKHKEFRDMNYRFDVFEIDIKNKKYRWIDNAFGEVA